MKHSFTSSSKHGIRASVTTFAISFTIIVLAGQQAGKIMAGKSFFNASAIMDDLPPAYTFPDRKDWYISYDEFGLDHYILYYGLGESIRYAKEADVLFVGNSQVAFGFPKNIIKQGKLKTGLKFYNLGFGYNEGGKFVLALIEKHDLHPRIVVANATLGRESNFFRPDASVFGQKVMESSQWEARKTVLEWRLSWLVRHSKLHEWFPDWRVLKPPGRIWLPRFINCRSISTGSWSAYRENQRPVPVGSPPVDFNVTTDSVDNEILASARNFKQALADRGTQLVLTWVPIPNSWHYRREAASLAIALDVPFIAPVVDGLITRDGGHLDDESALRFGSRFIEEFNEWLEEN